MEASAGKDIKNGVNWVNLFKEKSGGVNVNIFHEEFRKHFSYFLSNGRKR